VSPVKKNDDLILRSDQEGSVEALKEKEGYTNFSTELLPRTEHSQGEAIWRIRVWNADKPGDVYHVDIPVSKNA
jgi:hypothetical protein